MMPEIPKPQNLEEEVFRITNEKQFRQIALEVFRRQYFGTAIYRAYCDAIGKTPASVSSIETIPFLPISFFKSHAVKNADFEPVTQFQSSGTTGMTTSRHYIKDLFLYEKSFLACFEQFYGKPEAFCILGLLPSYLERGSSSLVYMVDTLIRKSGHPQSGFYLYDHDKLHVTLSQLEASGQQAILFGVTYALLDFAASHALPLKSTIVIETGGMKGRKKELTKEELYQQIRTAFSLPHVHAEYGMTELLSQAYAIDGIYRSPAWMRIVLRDETDPFCLGGSSGAINVIDLANLHSCSFIATEDLGKLHPNGSFEVLGRMDNTDIRGCSQLAMY